MDNPLNITMPDGGPASIKGLWAPNPGFLVGGGPSLADVDLNRLRERGVVSFGINQAAAFAPVKAWCFSDGESKFHHSLFLDPSIMTFTPNAKLKYRVRMKIDDEFRTSTIRVRDCPNTFAFERYTMFVPGEFFTTHFCHWGPRKHQPADKPEKGCLCTMLIGLRLMYWLGVKRFYLLGIDFKGRDGKCYGFDEEKNERNRRYRWESHMLEKLIPEFDKRGIEIFNCNRDSALKLFPFVSYEKALDDCKGSVGNEPLDTKFWYHKNEADIQCRANSEVTPIHFSDRDA